MTTPKWMDGRGYSGMEQRAEEERQRQFGPRRFWLKPNTSTTIVFVDDDPIRFMEHNPSFGDKWDNRATCPGDNCALCLVGDRATYCAAWTVIDRSEFVDKKTGKTRKDEVRLFVAKPQVIVKLARRAEKLRAGGKPDGLAGVVVEVHRGDEKTAGTGDDFEVVGLADKSLLLGPDGKLIKPFDYETILAPNDALLKRYARIIAGKTGQAVPF